MTPMRIQRIMMGIILITGLLLDLNGVEWGKYLIWFVALMALFAGITGFAHLILYLRR